MKLTRKLIAAMLSVCMVLALLTSAASAANINANYGAASYYEIAVSTYSRMLAFQNGGVVPAANKSKQYGLIDPTGKVILPFQYAEVWALDGGLFGVAKTTNEYGGHTGLGVVNSKGKVLLAPSDDCTDITCNNGIIRVTTRTVTTVKTDWGSFPSFNYSTKYYTTDWKASTEAAYNKGSSESTDNWESNIPAALREYSYYEEAGDYYRVTKYDDDWNPMVGILDSNYKVVIPLGLYKYVGTPNADGYISVTKQDGSTDLYKDGKVVKTYSKMVSTEVYFRYLTFSTTGEKHGMMDIDENVLLPEQYDVIDGDGNNYIRASKSKGEDSWEYVHGLYTQDCKQVFADTYSEITYLADGKYRLNDGTHFGVSKVDGTTVTPVIPMKYKDMRVYTLQFIELYDGSKYSVVDLSNKVVVPEGTEEINAFKGDAGGLGETLDRVSYYAEEYDGYTKTVLPFLSKTGSGWTTVYADYVTGEVEGQLSGVRASNINDDGWFVYQNANGLYGFGRVEGTGFLDIIPGHWAEKAVDWAVNGGKEITNGVGNGKFNPDAQCTNAMILTFLWRAAGKPASTAQLPIDITGKKVDYAEDALRWAAEKGMISKDFDPNAACTSASAVKFIWQAFDSPAPKGGSTFTDVPAGADYAAAVAWAEQLGITQGEGNHIFSPDKVCSRGRILTFLYRAYVEEARLK